MAWNKEIMRAASQALMLPSEAPVMFLPNAVLFPDAMLPLFIFEPRYRAMLAHALREQRMFCVALMKPDVAEVTGPEDFHHVAGVGLVRASVEREDGTSHLVLQGLARVQLGASVQEKPFRIMELRELPSRHSAPPDQDTLREKVRDLCAHLSTGAGDVREKLDQQLAQLSDPGALCDIVAHTFVRDPQRRQEALEELDTAARLRLVLRHLDEEAASA
jgi:Lon protease-like protein